MTYPETCWQKASESLGVQEQPIGSNWGRWIRVYLAFVSIFSPAAWCCAFVLYKLYQAAGIANVKVDFPKTGSCSSLARWARENLRIQSTPYTHVCLFVVRGKDKNGDYVPGLYTHVGFFRPSDNATVEGNSNDDGSAEGYEVVQRERDPSSGRYHFIDIWP